MLKTCSLIFSQFKIKRENKGSPFVGFNYSIDGKGIILIKREMIVEKH